MNIRSTVLLSVVLSGCGVGVAELGDDVQPTNDELASTAQELISCAARTETGYESGRPFPIVVVTVDGKPVERATANAYSLMQAAALRDGVSVAVVSGFRSMAEQRRLFACFEQCNCNNCNLAARPGFSNHQSGSALDLNTAAAGVYSWLVRNGSRFGFFRTVPSEDWHWEFLGPSPGRGPCDDPAPVPAVRFENLKAGGAYTNGLWMRVEASPRVRIVRYTSNGFPLGASEHRAQQFAARYVFSSLGERVIVAEGFDEDLKSVGKAEVTIRVASGEVARGSLSFESPIDGGQYPNGLVLKTRATGPITRVEYSAGGFAVGSSTDVAAQFPARVTFNTLGWRALTAVGFDANGAEVTRRSIVVRITP
jgi:hypothetical protein